MNDALDQTAPKSMRLFFIDNQGAWPKSAHLVGDLVVWQDPGQYPTYVPVAAAEHPNFQGKILVHAGNRGLVMTFVNGADAAEMAKNTPYALKNAQYRIAIDALIHRMVLWLDDANKSEDEPITMRDDADALSLAAWMAASKQSRPYARVIMSALSYLMKNADRLTALTADVRANGAAPDADAFEMADALQSSMVQAVAAKDAQAAEAPVLRRTT